MELNSALNADKIEKPKSKRRWYQYSLRTLLIFMFIFVVMASEMYDLTAGLFFTKTIDLDSNETDISKYWLLIDKKIFQGYC
jgi:hypothetical protein